MTAELFDQWLASLEACRAPYSRDVLRDGDSGWSPLGLLCDLIDRRGWSRAERTGAWYWRGDPCGPSGNAWKRAGVTGRQACVLFNLQQHSAGFAEFAAAVRELIAPGPAPPPPPAPEPPAKRGRKATPRADAPDAGDDSGLFRGSS